MPSEQLEGVLEVFIWGTVASLLLSYGLVLKGRVEGFASDAATDIVATKLKLMLSDTQMYKNTQRLILPHILDEKFTNVRLEGGNIIIDISSKRTFPLPVKVLNEPFELETATEYALVPSREGILLSRSGHG